MPNKCLLLLLGALFLLTQPLFAATRTIEEIELVPSAEGTEVQIRFNLPLRYLAHSPLDKGELLQVEMRPLFAETELPELAGRKVYSWPPSSDQPLRQLTYEGDAPGGPQLILEFDRTIEYRIKSSADPLRLSILLLPRLKIQRPELTPPVAEKPVAVESAAAEIIPPEVPSGVSPVDISLSYVVNLESSLKPVSTQLPGGRPDLEQYRLYQTRFRKDGQLWYRLRLGFFADKESAQKVLLSLKELYPEAWLARASLVERENSAASALYEPAPLVAEVPARPAEKRVEPPVTPAYTQAVSKTQRLLDEAEAAMVAGDYQRAAILYSRLKQAQDPKVRQLAQEYLGLARDRANQLAHAKAEYENYLELYPEGEGAERVRQRLAALLTARSTPKAPLRKARQVAGGWQHEAYGSFSQFYYHDSLTTDAGGTLLAQSTLRSDLDLNTRSRSENLDFRTTFIGGYENDFRDQGDDEFRVSSLYADLVARRPDLSLRLGRQSRSSGGVLGRFDGGLLRWQARDRVAFNLVGGFPVLSASDTDLNTDRPFYGLSVDLGTFARRWDVSLFIIEQQNESLIDRRAVGGEVRYFEPTRSFFALVDYDILYDELNTALFNGSLRLPDNTTLTLSADYRSSPILTTANALIGQTTLTSIDQLRQLYSEDEIRQLALDRTATSQNYTFGVTRPLSPKLQLSADITLARLGSTPASGGVEAMPGTGNDLFYALQLIGSSLIKEGDIAIIGLRYSDTSTSDTWALNLNTRYPLTQALRLNPKLLVDYRSNKDSADNRWRLRPALRMEYRWKRRVYLELEGGGEWAWEEIAGQQGDSRDIFFTLGYRLDF